MCEEGGEDEFDRGKFSHDGGVKQESRDGKLRKQTKKRERLRTRTQETGG